MSAHLIAIEGSDGAGKGTQADLLVQNLRALGHKVAMLSFPRYTQTIAGAICGRMLKRAYGPASQLAPELKMLAFAADRFETLPLMQQLMADNDYLVVDRYVASNAAYQGAFLTPDAFPDFAAQVFALEYSLLPKPSVNILLEVDPLAAMAKAKARAALDENESNLALQQAVPQRYAYLAAHGLGGPWQSLRVQNADGAYRPRQDIGTELLAHLQALNVC